MFVKLKKKKEQWNYDKPQKLAAGENENISGGTVDILGGKW